MSDRNHSPTTQRSKQVVFSNTTIQYLNHIFLMFNQNSFVLDLFRNVEHCASLTVPGKTLGLFIDKNATVFIILVKYKPWWSGH